MARLLDYDPIMKSKQLFHIDHSDDSYVIESLTDVEPVLEANRAASNQFDERSNWRGDFHRVASIPMCVFMGLPREVREDNRALLRWLDNTDQRPFRTRPGRLAK